MRNNKFCNALILFALLYAPTGLASTLTEFTFQSVITNANNYRDDYSRLTSGDSVSGHFIIDSDDQQADVYSEPGFTQYTFSSSTSSTSGEYSQIPSGHARGPINQVRLGLEQDYVLEADDLPADVLSLVPSTVDLISFEVERTLGDIGGENHFELFEIMFVYDPLDNIFSGTDGDPSIDEVDFSRLFTAAIYTDFSAERIITDGITEDGIPVWDAYGAATVSAVPVPAALWLFGSGLLGILGFRRRRVS